MARKSNVTTIQSVTIEFDPNPEKVSQAIKIAATGYRKALIKQMKQRAEESKSPA